MGQPVLQEPLAMMELQGLPVLQVQAGRTELMELLVQPVLQVMMAL